MCEIHMIRNGASTGSGFVGVCENFVRGNKKLKFATMCCSNLHLFESSNDNWFGSWLNAAKNKSNEVLEFVKKDLEEFGNAVKTEANNVVSSTGSAIEKTFKFDEPDSTANTMKRSISSFLGQMNNAMNPSPDDSDTEAILIIEGSETVTLTKLQRAIYDLQQDENTFLEDPDASLHKQYNCWLEIIDDQLVEERLTRHLTNSVTLNNQYLKLVPDKVSHQIFWKRYLFRKALLEDSIAHQEAMEKREIKEKQMTEDHLKWDQEDFATDIELSEEQQMEILQQYEDETKQKHVNKQANSISPLDKPVIGEEILFQKPSPLKTAKIPSKETEVECKKSKSDTSVDKIVLERNENHFKEHAVIKKNSHLNIRKNDSSNSLDMESKSSNSSSDGDWEKVSDVEK